MPLHPKAKEFAKSALFAGVKSFADLEKRIAAITENKGKGDAFEVFAEAYLATQRRHEVGTAWPLDAVPLDLLKKLKLPLKDYGVDGVTRTTLGGHQVYQVKFRSGRTPLTWEELSTFMGLSDCPEIQSKIVITNCDDLPAVINERHNFFCIRGSDLDRLTAEDFKVIEAWVSEAAIAFKRSTPFPHQQEALDAIVPALKTEDRVSAIMACGTGKTLTALWASEQLGPSKVLVLLPSLALLRQTLHEWLKETSLDLAYFCVCSDPSVKDDADSISTAQSDLDFEVSTDSATVRRFLDAPFKGTKVIFSTYQSASVVGEAMKKGEGFDLGIFDEAHKTAGREGRNYGYALEDRNIAIRKRLFVTATPRHYNPSKKNKEGEATVAFSMDEPKVYGPQSYVLSFGEAARRKIICGYKVIISVITSDQVNDEVLSKGTVSVKGDEIRARQVANQIALRDAVAQYGVSKIFTFHSTVKSAASFVADGNEGVRTHLPEFSTLHVSGAMPTARRERGMKDFRSARKAVMSNARCLTEGVDVPAVDMVAFLSPKKSKVNIVQAIGRAMRRSGSKEVGYVLIPLYLEQKAGETLEEAVARANFEEVWDILQSLQEQDEVLAELIRDMAVAKGSGKGFDDSRFSDRINFTGPVLALESIRQAVTTRVLERLESSWDVNFGKLVKFKEEHGHCRVPQRVEKLKELSSWVSNTRYNYSKKLLSLQRVSALENLGFEWNILSSEWDMMFDELIKYKKQHGNCLVPINFYENIKLGRWVATQRSIYRKGLLDSQRFNKLKEIGFEWDLLDKEWFGMLARLKKYNLENGHCNVPQSIGEIGVWVNRQRSYYKKSNLSPLRIKELESLDFDWDPINTKWHKSFLELVSFKQKTGNLSVPYNHPLRSWINTQRKRFILKKIDKKHLDLLESIGFDFEKLPYWDEMYANLVEYKSINGNCRVPNRYKENERLGHWVANQRSYYAKKKLSFSQIKKLEELGFEWDIKSSEWIKSFEDLLLFKTKHGHCRVPITYKNNKKLAIWVHTQRYNYNRDQISKEQIEKLNSIGFEWDPFNSDWDSCFNALREYIIIHRSSNVPLNYISGDLRLGKWVSRQRQRYKKGFIPVDRITKLDEIGFEWNITSNSWEIHFEELKSFKERFGHFRVPYDSKDYKRLRVWINNLRANYSKGKITPDRVARLDALGFV
jgi:superfamily II DNA or RNA helicase